MDFDDSENDLPESVKHWAIFLGDNQYLSKFGRSGKVLKAY